MFERQRVLITLLVIYAVATLIHFVHNAEFISDYPNLPRTWSRVDVYLAWAALTAIGIVGWVLVWRGHLVIGLVVLVAYAAGGLDSLGHYILAPLSQHTAAMNSTILLEVTCAGLVLAEVTRQLVRRLSTAGTRASR